MPFRVPVNTQEPLNVTQYESKVTKRVIRLLRPALGATYTETVSVPSGKRWRIIMFYASISYGAVDQSQYMSATIKLKNIPNGQGNAIHEMFFCPFTASTRQVVVFGIGGGGNPVTIPEAAPATIYYQPLPDIWIDETCSIEIRCFNPTAAEGFLVQISIEEVIA